MAQLLQLFLKIKIRELENKTPVHAKYITTEESNKLIAKKF